MIMMIISDEVNEERQFMAAYVKDWAGRWTDERWKILQCAARKELEDVVSKQMKADILCVDITMAGALELTKDLRKLLPSSYIILIASPRISPVTYLRPSVGAESLLLKPLVKEQVREILGEALRTYVGRFCMPDEKKVFVIESGGERKLIDYNNIFFFEAREKRVYLNTEMEEYAFYDTLDQLEKRLSSIFIRCHRSFLVNRYKIEKIFLSQNRLVLEGDFDIPLSRSYKPAIKEYLSERENI